MTTDHAPAGGTTADLTPRRPDGAGAAGSNGPRAGTAGPDDDRGAVRRRSHHRVTIELAVLVAVLAIGTALRWVDGVTPAPLPALQSLGASVLPAAGVTALAVLGRRRRVALAATAVTAVQVALVRAGADRDHLGRVAAAAGHRRDRRPAARARRRSERRRRAPGAAPLRRAELVPDW